MAGNAFTDEAARRVQRSVQVTEALRPPTAPVGQPGAPSGTNVQFVRVTGASTTVDGTAFYPGRLRTFVTGGGGGWTDLTVTDDVKVSQVVGAGLQTNGTGVYLAKLVGTITVSGTEYPHFATAGRVC
jgi:hypothetical protein